jgi:hypothetical protein
MANVMREPELGSPKNIRGGVMMYISVISLLVKCVAIREEVIYVLIISYRSQIFQILGFAFLME